MSCLVSNAVKFTINTAIVIIVSMEYDKDLINVIVSDNGIGIEKELFQRICKGETVYDKTTK